MGKVQKILFFSSKSEGRVKALWGHDTGVRTSPKHTPAGARSKHAQAGATPLWLYYPPCVLVFCFEEEKQLVDIIIS